MKKEREYITNIKKVIEQYNIKISNIYIKDNCIYGITIKGVEGLYAGSDEDYSNVYKVFDILKKELNL